MKAILTWAMGALLAASSLCSYAAPIILHGPPTAHAGDVIALQGDSFGGAAQVQYSYNSTTWTSLTPISTATNFVTVKLPMAGQLPINLVTVRVSADGSTWSSPFFINKPRAMHFDTPEIAPGSAFRIFGRNLAYGTAAVRLVDVSVTPNVSCTASVDAANSNAYVLKATAPAGTAIVAGHNYEVWVSNGLTGQSAYGNGESKAEKTLLGRVGGTDYWNLGVPWAADFNFYGTIYNVKTQYGAYGDGIHSDQAAIQNAITAAGNNPGGGVVYLPAGTYRLEYNPDQSFGLQIPSRVVLKGDGMTSTKIQYGFGALPTLGYTGFGISIGNGWDAATKCGIADLTIENVNTSGHWKNNLLIAASSYGTDAAHMQKTSEIFLQRVKVLVGSEQLRMQHIDKMVVANSDFEMLGSPDYVVCWLGIGDISNYNYKSNILHWSGGGAAAFNDSRDGVIEGNHFTRDCNYSLYPNIGDTRAFDVNFNTNFAILNNTFDVTGGTPDQTHYDGETILTEGGGPNRGDEFIGAVTATGTANNTLQDSSRTWGTFIRQATVAIVAGTGAGQWRSITGLADSHTLLVDRAWDVKPTAGSRYSVFDWSASNWLVLNNTLSGNAHGILLYTACSHDVAIANNSLTDNDGIELRPDQFSSNPPTRQVVIWDTQVTGNTVTDISGVTPAYIGVLGVQWYSPTTLGTEGLGIEIRNNTVNAHMPNISTGGNELGKEGFYNYWDTERLGPWTEASPVIPGILGTVLQNNVANNCDKAFYLSTGSYQTTLMDNIVRGTGAVVQDDTLIGASHSSVGTVQLNTWRDADIGAPGLAGSTTAKDSIFTVKGSGADIYAASDQFHFTYQSLAGDGSVVARVTSEQYTNAWAKAGVMVRTSLAANANFVDMVVTPGSGVNLQYRNSANPSGGWTGGSGSAIYWVKLVRSGGMVTGYSAPDSGGNPGTWTQIGSGQPIAAGTAYVGLCLTSHDNGQLNTTVIDNVSTTGTALIPLNKIVSFRALANNQYVCADIAGANPLIANRTSVGPWEQFLVEDAGGGNVYLKSQANGKYVTAGASPLIASQTTHGTAETFKWVDQGNGQVSFLALANNLYVCADNGGSSPLIANRNYTALYETFLWAGY